ncbi:Cof-type HAD-IIB family hydrolase [uncultured Dubosiella sp.]|uniref:Cof-type HAD-IIB family hydrolase n=1 Tax=uncultured Dubosiella sp. TaxID=1937011 RepID=UPI00261C585A|nr:Cof-type HAD-IIB family hydrolase [uncultured Dubosiella sp.]
MNNKGTLVLDIDGTLLSSEKKLTKRTKEALIEAQKQGWLLILASGRPVNGLMRFSRELKMDAFGGALVAFNGSKVVDMRSGEVLFEQPMSVSEGKAVLEHLKNFDVIVLIDHDEYMLTNDVYRTIERNGRDFAVIEYESRSNNYLLCEKKDLAAFVDFPLNKILTAATPAYLQAHWKEMAAPFQDRLNSMFTADFYFEFTAKGIDKAQALRKTMEKLGCRPEDMIAFGDAQNDRSMLEMAGVGIAMGNATDELKQVADVITCSNDEDGIAVYLEEHVL